MRENEQEEEKEEIFRDESRYVYTKRLTRLGN